MAVQIVFLLLITLVYADIKVDIDVASDQRYANAGAFGEQTDIISDTERDTFGLNDEDLKEALGKLRGKRPDDAFLHSPTPWEDLYKRYHWHQVRTTLRPVRTRVLGVKTSPVILAGKKFENRSPYSAQYKGEIAEEISTSIATTTSKGGSFTAGQEVTYTVNFGGGSVGGKTSLSFSNNWGESKTETKKSSLKTGSSVTIDLKPGEACKAVLCANQGTMEVEVEYEASVSGCVAHNYEYTFEGHHFWCLDVNYVLSATGRPTTIRSTERIEIGFYTDETVIIFRGNETQIV